MHTHVRSSGIQDRGARCADRAERDLRGAHRPRPSPNADAAPHSGASTNAQTRAREQREHKHATCTHRLTTRTHTRTRQTNTRNCTPKSPSADGCRAGRSPLVAAVVEHAHKQATRTYTHHSTEKHTHTLTNCTSRVSKC